MIVVYLDFLQTYFYKKDFYHKQSDALCNVRLPFRDHEYRLKNEVALGQNLVEHLKSELYPLIESICLRSGK